MSFRPLPARRAEVLLNQSKPLNALFQGARQLERLQEVVSACLQPAARPHCHVAAWKDACLLLIVTDSHWATRLRYQQRRLARQLQATREFANLTKIHVKVQPPVVAPGSNQPPRRLSNSAAQTLSEAAECIDDIRLKQALERLASRAGKAPPAP